MNLPPSGSANSETLRRGSRIAMPFNLRSGTTILSRDIYDGLVIELDGHKYKLHSPFYSCIILSSTLSLIIILLLFQFS